MPVAALVRKGKLLRLKESHGMNHDVFYEEIFHYDSYMCECILEQACMSNLGLLFASVLDITLTYALIALLFASVYPILNKGILDTVKP